MESPIGHIGIVASRVGILHIGLNVEFPEKFGEMISAWLGPTVSNPENPFLKETTKQLKEYFERKRRKFNIPLDLRCNEFTRRVLKEVSLIPYGNTVTYGEFARRIGSPKAARAVGGAVGANPIPIIIPCHRVVAAGGKLGGFGGGIALKMKLLKLENITE